MTKVRLFKKGEVHRSLVELRKPIRCHTENPELISLKTGNLVQIFEVSRQLKELPHGGVLIKTLK